MRLITYRRNSFGRRSYSALLLEKGNKLCSQGLRFISPLVFCFGLFQALGQNEDTLKYERYSQKTKQYYLSHPDSNLLYIDSLLYLFEEKGLALAKAKALRMQGVFYHLKSQNDSALYFYRKAHLYSRQIGDVTISAESQLNVGMIFFNQGQFDSSLYHSKKALESFQKSNNEPLIGRATGEIAKAYSMTGDHEKALPFFRLALQSAIRNDDRGVLASAYSFMCTVFNYLNQFDSSIYYAHKAIPLFQEANNIGGLGSMYQNLGNIYRDLSSIDSSYIYYQKSLTILKRWDYAKGLGEAYYNIGGLKDELGEKQAAINLFQEALKQSKRANDLHLISLISEDLSKIYAEKKDYRNAYQNQLTHKLFNDSIFGIEKQKNISELQTQYETEKKEQQIALQHAQLAEQESEIQRNQILLYFSLLALLLLIVIVLLWKNRTKKRQELELQKQRLVAQKAEINAAVSSQEKERTRYAMDLHDGFGQMISVLNMNLKGLEEARKPDTRQQIFNASTEVIDDMYKELKSICFDLMPQTLIKQGLEQGLQEFALRINQSKEVFVEINVFGLEKRLLEVQEISLYRISQEWINNILKYSDANKIVVQITKDADEITLLIEDNGSGFDKNALMQSEGYGWKNMNVRANIISGEIELETQHGIKGSTFILNAPAHLSKVGFKENTIKTV